MTLRNPDPVARNNPAGPSNASIHPGMGS